MKTRADLRCFRRSDEVTQWSFWGALSPPWGSAEDRHRVRAAVGIAPGRSPSAYTVDQLGSLGPKAFLEIADPWEMAGFISF